MTAILQDREIEPIKVYIVSDNNYFNCYIVGVFSSKVRAEKFVKDNQDYDSYLKIKEFMLDEGV